MMLQPPERTSRRRCNFLTWVVGKGKFRDTTRLPGSLVNAHPYGEAGAQKETPGQFHVRLGEYPGNESTEDNYPSSSLGMEVRNGPACQRPGLRTRPNDLYIPRVRGPTTCSATGFRTSTQAPKDHLRTLLRCQTVRTLLPSAWKQPGFLASKAVVQYLAVTLHDSWSEGPHD